MKDFREFKFAYQTTNSPRTCQAETLQYYSNLRGEGKNIFDYLHGKRHLPFTKIRNATIAKQFGCSVRTVQRWTAEFARKGLITKHRHDIFETNHYKNHISNSMAFSLWFNKLSDHEQDQYMTHGIVIKKKKRFSLQYETVTPIYNTLPQDIYLQTNPNPIARDVRVRYARARTIPTEMVIDGDGFGFLSKKEREKKERVLKGIEMLNQEQKEWILKHGDDERVKQYIMGDTVKPLLITPLIESITKLLDLDLREQFKLVAYPEDALQDAHDRAQKIVDGVVKSGPIRDRMAWFLYMANDYCKKNSLAIDWKWYFDITRILGIQALQHGEPSKPLIVKSAKPKNQYQPLYGPQKEEPVAVKIEKLRQDIADTEVMLSEALASGNGFLQVMIPGFRESIIRKKQQLQELNSEVVV